MSSVHDTLARAFDEITKARALVAKNNARQVRNADQRDLLRSVGYAWFKSHRPVVQQYLSSTAQLSPVDNEYRLVLDGSEKHSARGTYLAALKAAKNHLLALRAELVVAAVPAKTDEQPPNLSPLAADQAMQNILIRRWHECRRCILGGAPLAATVMMGGLLEALLVARANTLKGQGAALQMQSDAD